MDYTDILLTTAEIGVTIAGFSSLATLLLTQPGRELTLDTYRFEGMLINSLLVIAFALLPTLLLALKLDELLTWRISSFILIVIYGSRSFLVTRNTLQFKRAGQPIGRPFYIMTSLMLLVISALTVNVVFLPPAFAAGLYLVGVYGVLANACVLFLLVFVAALRTQRES